MSGAAQGAIGDGEVVVNEIELAVAGARKEDLVRISDRDLAAVDLEHRPFHRLRPSMPS